LGGGVVRESVGGMALKGFGARPVVGGSKGGGGKQTHALVGKMHMGQEEEGNTKVGLGKYRLKRDFKKTQYLLVGDGEKCVQPNGVIVTSKMVKWVKPSKWGNSTPHLGGGAKGQRKKGT